MNFDLFEYEKKLKKSASMTVCGVDEAGAGPLLGPVYAAAVILPEHVELDGLNDSKKLSSKKREKLYDLICCQAVSYCITCISAIEIDETDILSARLKAMQEAINGLNSCEMALIDGNRDKGKYYSITTPHQLVVHGDTLCASIAAASILAKVSRDRYCIDVLDKMYPEYFIAKHKGYGTKLHYEMIEKFGPCPEHRMSFLKSMKGK